MAPLWFRLKRFIFPVGNRTLKIYVVMVKGVVEDNNVKFMQVEMVLSVRLRDCK
jgi:hypothetical protein